MLFQHTLNQVLDGSKTQSSRIWKDSYYPEYYEGELIAIRRLNGNLLYYIGQELSVQPSRGKKGVARIRIQELHKADVRTFDAGDFERETLNDILFYKTWTSMHDKAHYKVTETHSTNEWIKRLNLRPEQFYTALVFIFELVTESALA